jgi:hypothetical protein
MAVGCHYWLANHFLEPPKAQYFGRGVELGGDGGLIRVGEKD